MITTKNLKDLLKNLNFAETKNVFSKYYPENSNAYLKVDFNEGELIYPTDKGFVVNGEFTTNFTSDENFVVFECVNRLFEKGYKPEHIELEPKWKVGHGASGGRADILIKDNSGKSLLIIECKTEGAEFNKEWKNTLQRGGQMLTYAKQAGSTQYVCLYASDFVDGKTVYFSNIISLTDNEKLLQELADKKPLSFKDAKALEVEDIYKAWKETYNLNYATKGIFENDILPYQIGKEKYTINDLAEVGSKDIQSKYHEFATILRQHNVSGRENAFDKLVNLFLCKIVDEAKNPNDLKFNWKGIAIDTYFDLQDRLQLLYQAGMKEFLGEDVTYIDNKTIDKAFRFVKKDPDATRDTIKKYFRQLKFFTNNDFAFIDVHNEKLFYQNAEVLLQIVQMLQDTKLQSETQNQFLGDMFEGFLDQGVKQSEGQFFTPMPIVKFILNSLPLENIIKQSDLPPKAIDYACGAGHFLNELALQLKPFVEQHKKIDVKEYYKEIVGIEKEYRLSKVAKVSAFMYRQDEIKIKYADALGLQANLQDGEYSILVANPPYAVKGFLQTLTEIERKKYTLLSAIEEKSIANNNSIETFFIERAKQLLKPEAVAAIILPSSILSNDAAIYTQTREIILKYFQIVAIAEFGSQTFGKTGTNTVALFLKRKEENPAPADHWKYRIDAWFADNDADVVYNDGNYINQYCQHIEIDATHYKTLLKGNPSDELLKTEMFVEYKKAFDKQKKEKNFIAYLQNIEKDKLYYYVLAAENKNKVLVVKCPADNKEQKQFLGYEWSSAKGNEGIKYINTKTVKEEDDAEEILQKMQGLQHINTPLYNPNKTEDSDKINYYIQQNFLGNEHTISETLKTYLNYYQLTDMLDFSRVSFNKQITLTPKKNTQIQSKWELVKIGELIKEQPKSKIQVNEAKDLEYAEYPFYTSGENIYKFNKYIVDNENIFLSTGGNAVIKFYDGKAAFSTDTWVIKSNDEKTILTYYIYVLLWNLTDLINTEYFKGVGLKHLQKNDFREIKIPLPPLNVQQQIVDECTAIDKEVEKAELETEKANKKINESIEGIVNSNFREETLDAVAKEIFAGGDAPKGNMSEMKTTEYNIPIFSNGKENKGLYGFTNISRVNETCITISARGTLGYTEVRTEPFFPIVRLIVLIPSSIVNVYYLKHIVNRLNFANTGGVIPQLTVPKIKGVKIPVPSITEQEKLVSLIEALETKIAESQTIINNAPNKKQEIMKKYL